MTASRTTGEQAYRPVLPVTRVLLALFAALTALAVLALLVRADHTDQTFAWTVEPPLSAAFLGAAYGAGCMLVVLTLRASWWAQARLPILVVGIFTLLTLLATVLHRDRFHFSAGEALPRWAAWFWLAVYVGLPVLIAVAVAVQERLPGEDPPRAHPLPTALAGLLAVQGLVMAFVGAGLYLAVDAVVEAWPWTLTPLVARAIGAWLLAFAFYALLASVRGDLVLMRVPAVAYAVFGALELLALGLHAGDLASGPGAAVTTGAYVVVLVSVVVAGLAGWELGGRRRGGEEDVVVEAHHH